MPRPARFDADRLLDAAVHLVAAGGPAAVSMAAVARAAGAPSGSVYHRFPSRSALLAALWLRTVAEFQQGFIAALRGDEPAHAARHVVAWSRANPERARVLLHGMAAYAPDEWPGDDRQRAGEADERLGAALRAVGHPSLEQVIVALVDIPYAFVRRHLQAGTPIPAGAEEMAEAAARAVLDFELPWGLRWPNLAR
ncbi:MAG TPA: TetR/AcrR family transcriptional regulator [Pilimelia sp.]|nr:TetR/AcrR family transcriptional regulator [Pilimelia sp.]